MGFGNMTAERAALETTYEDTAAILRGEDISGPDYITRRELEPVYQHVPCALSYNRGADASVQTGAQHNIDYSAVLFMAPELSILPGDFAEVNRFGAALSFQVVGRPRLYATHQEIHVKDRDIA